MGERQSLTYLFSAGIGLLLLAAATIRLQEVPWVLVSVVGVYLIAAGIWGWYERQDRESTSSAATPAPRRPQLARGLRFAGGILWIIGAVMDLFHGGIGIGFILLGGIMFLIGVGLQAQDRLAKR